MHPFVPAVVAAPGIKDAPQILYSSDLKKQR